MAAITYTANSRAPLVATSPAHTAGTDYNIDVKLQAFNEGIDIPKSTHVSLGAQVETVLQRASNVYSMTLIWPYTLDDDMREFLYSVAAGESFTFDAYGTVAVADNPLSVVCLNDSYSITRLQHGKDHWRGVSLTIRPTA